MKELVVEKENELKRLDVFLVSNLNESRNFILKNIKNGNITVNDNIVKGGYSLKEGDIIKIKDLTIDTSVKAEDIDINILYEDDDIIVVNKKSGMVVHPGNGNYSKTLVINIGSDNGLKEKMTVIADEGLVGYVVSTTNKTAKVQTIVDSASATSCIASSTRDTMICKGTIENKSVLSASNIDTDARIIQGDSVETSGLGGIYLKGIHVGKIKKVNEGSN